MIKTSFIRGLILGLTLFGRTLWADNTTIAESAVASTTSKVATNKSQTTRQPADSPKQSICKANEVKTPFGCETAVGPKTQNQLRVPVVSSTLNSDNTVMHSSIGVRPPQRDNKLEHPKKRKKYRRIMGKNRPWKYVFLPGRRLRKGKRCRPNEVQGMKRRCIRKRHSKDSKLPSSETDT